MKKLCCVPMERAVGDGYIVWPITYTKDKQMSHLPFVIPPSERGKPSFVINFCPWCGVGLREESGSECDGETKHVGETLVELGKCRGECDQLREVLEDCLCAMTYIVVGMGSVCLRFDEKTWLRIADQYGNDRAWEYRNLCEAAEKAQVILGG